jgi:DNA-directed RNA polymerase II subunit RPB9
MHNAFLTVLTTSNFTHPPHREQSGIVNDLQTDPTLPHSSIPNIGTPGTPTSLIHCPNPAGCTNTDAVYFQDQSKRKHTRMILFYVCTKCNYLFGDPELEKSGKRGVGAGVEKEEEEFPI